MNSPKLEPGEKLIARIRANFPQELIGNPGKPQAEKWCLWKYVERSGKLTKLPFQPNGSPAESNNKKTWSTFDAVSEVFLAGKFDGIGCFISEPYVAVDFDHVCKDFDPSTIETWVLEAVSRLGSYTEFSPSGEGLHVWSYGKLPGKGKRAGRIEIYGEGRYFTVTGIRL
jgi:putative DNA primase/helicase